MDDVVVEPICGTCRRMMTFLEVCLREGSSATGPVEDGRVVVSIGDIEIRIERVLESTLEVVEPTVKVAL